MLAYYLYTNVLRTKNITLKLLELKFSNWFGHDLSCHIGSRTILNDYLACIVRMRTKWYRTSICFDLR